MIDKLNFEDEEKLGFIVSKNRKKMWSVELEILQSVSKLCEENNIKYFMIAGTELGASRHNGFIPWDDDIDIGMLRSDFDRFIEVISNTTDFPYEIQFGIFNKGNDFDSLLRIRDANTTGIIKKQANRNINQGIFIEIYPFDNIADNFIARKIQLKISRILNFAIADYIYNFENKNVITRIGLFIMHLFSLETLWKWYKLICTKYNDKTTKCISTVAIPWLARQGELLFYLEDVVNTKFMKFENIDVRVPEGNERCLRMQFGDYMKLPPLEQRGVHHEEMVYYDPLHPYKYYEGIEFEQLFKKYGLQI